MVTGIYCIFFKPYYVLNLTYFEFLTTEYFQINVILTNFVEIRISEEINLST